MRVALILFVNQAAIINCGLLNSNGLLFNKLIVHVFYTLFFYDHDSFRAHVHDFLKAVLFNLTFRESLIIDFKMIMNTKCYSDLLHQKRDTYQITQLLYHVMIVSLDNATYPKSQHKDNETTSDLVKCHIEYA